jgi:hypothetical protein
MYAIEQAITKNPSIIKIVNGIEEARREMMDEFLRFAGRDATPIDKKTPNVTIYETADDGDRINVKYNNVVKGWMGRYVVAVDIGYYRVIPIAEAAIKSIACQQFVNMFSSTTCYVDSDAILPSYEEPQPEPESLVDTVCIYDGRPLELSVDYRTSMDRSIDEYAASNIVHDAILTNVAASELITETARKNKTTVRYDALPTHEFMTAMAQTPHFGGIVKPAVTWKNPCAISLIKDSAAD